MYTCNTNEHMYIYIYIYNMCVCVGEGRGGAARQAPSARLRRLENMARVCFANG